MIAQAKYFEYIPRLLGVLAKKELGADGMIGVRCCTCIGATTQVGDMIVVTDGDVNAHSLLQADDLPDAEVTTRTNVLGETMYRMLDVTSEVLPVPCFSDTGNIYDVFPTEPLGLMFAEVFLYTEDDDGVLHACSKMYRFAELRNHWEALLSMCRKYHWRTVVLAAPNVREDFTFDSDHEVTLLGEDGTPVWSLSESDGVNITTKDGNYFYEL